MGGGIAVSHKAVGYVKIRREEGNGLLIGVLDS